MQSLWPCVLPCALFTVATCTPLCQRVTITITVQASIFLRTCSALLYAQRFKEVNPCQGVLQGK